MTNNKTRCLLRLILRATLVQYCCCATATAQSTPHFMELSNDMIQVAYGLAAMGDIDNDGFFDFVVSGLQRDRIGTNFYRFGGYDWISPFSVSTVTYEMCCPEQPGIIHGALGWIDLDDNGYLDFYLSGSSTSEYPYEPQGVFYMGNESSNQEFLLGGTDMGMVSTYSGSVNWADYDNDGDPDLLLTGVSEDGFTTKLYRTESTPRTGWNYTEIQLVEMELGLPGIAFGEGIWGDFDNDGDHDVLVTGLSDAGFITEIYRNDNTTFRAINANLPGLFFSDADWGDCDNDGDLDLLLTGATTGVKIAHGVTRVYRNDNGIFTDIQQDFTGVFSGGSTWGDFDGDGYLDILLVGAEKMLDKDMISRLYLNRGNNTFTPDSSLIVSGVSMGSLAIGDLEGDYDLDVVTVGQTLGRRTVPYMNNFPHSNQPPEPPTNLQAVEAGDGSVTLSWQAASDDRTPSQGLTYNIQIRSSPPGLRILSPMADRATGRRLISAPGNVGPNTTWTLRELPTGTYYWSVQAIDHGYLGSAFAEEVSITIDPKDHTLTVHVFDIYTGDPVENALIKLYKNGQVVDTGATDPSGVAQLTVAFSAGEKTETSVSVRSEVPDPISIPSPAANTTAPSSIDYEMEVIKDGFETGIYALYMPEDIVFTARLVVRYTNTIGTEFIRIPAGTFEMGDISGNGYPNEHPVHTVTLTRDFLMGRYEVTQAEYVTVVGTNPSENVGDDRLPVENVSWYDAVQYANGLSIIEGFEACYDDEGNVIAEGGNPYACQGYRLPTEAEWEYAARAGTTTEFSFGDDLSELGNYAWYPDYWGLETYPVGEKLPNHWGLYDIHGNVVEWVHDWYSESYYSSSPSSDPTGPSAGSDRVERGGIHIGWGGFDLRSASRDGISPSVRRGGFRLARTAR